MLSLIPHVHALVFRRSSFDALFVALRSSVVRSPHHRAMGQSRSSTEFHDQDSSRRNTDQCRTSSRLVSHPRAPPHARRPGSSPSGSVLRPYLDPIFNNLRDFMNVEEGVVPTRRECEQAFAPIVHSRSPDSPRKRKASTRDFFETQNLLEFWSQKTQPSRCSRYEKRRSDI